MTMQIDTTRTAARWELDPANSAVDFQARHGWGLIPAEGRFSRFTGSYSVDDDHRAIELTIDASSVDTGNGKRDRHLRTADYFAVDAHPHVRFTSNDVTDAAPGMLHVAGRLEVAGTSVPLAFDATIREVGDELEIEATTTVDHHLFGMARSPLGMLRPLIALHVRARLHPTSETNTEEQS
jgi:polyisoprenoid-binding protein YceI